MILVVPLSISSLPALYSHVLIRVLLLLHLNLRDGSEDWRRQRCRLIEMRDVRRVGARDRTRVPTSLSRVDKRIRRWQAWGLLLLLLL